MRRSCCGWVYVRSAGQSHSSHLGAAKYDMMRGTIFVVCCAMLQYVDVSLVYHYIRGQSIIKLYVIYNVLEVRKMWLAGLKRRCLSTR